MRSNDYQRQRSSAKVNSAQTACAESEQAPKGAPDSEQWLSGAPPDCPVAPLVRAPTVEPQRLGDVAGAPDCLVCPSTTAFPNGYFGGWVYKYPPTTTLQDIQVFSQHIQYKS
jgi:hypothetical protein